MKLTPSKKKYIDALSYEKLLEGWRKKPLGDDWFQGETGEYWAERMYQLRRLPGGNTVHVAASKKIGW